MYTTLESPIATVLPYRQRHIAKSGAETPNLTTPPIASGDEATAHETNPQYSMYMWPHWPREEPTGLLVKVEMIHPGEKRSKPPPIWSSVAELQTTEPARTRWHAILATPPTICPVRVTKNLVSAPFYNERGVDHTERQDDMIPYNITIPD